MPDATRIIIVVRKNCFREHALDFSLLFHRQHTG